MIVSFLMVADGLVGTSDKYEEQRRVWGGVVDFMGVSLLKVLGSAPRLPGKVRQLLRLRSFERSMGTFGAGGPSAVSSACFQWFPLHAWSGSLIRIYSLCLLKRCTNEIGRASCRERV